MVTEGAFGKLKGRWGILKRMCDCDKATANSMTLARIVLHNLCITLGDLIPRHLDVNMDVITNKMRPRDIVRDMMQMRNCRSVRDSSREATRIKSSLMDCFSSEKASVNRH